MHLFRRPLLSLALVAALTLISAPAGHAAEPDAPIFPRPGGGPQAIHALSSITGEPAVLLDTDTGEYRTLPYLSISLSPDLRTVAVEREDGTIGVANRRALLRVGAAAIRWTGLYSSVSWSPDGTALLHTRRDRETGTAVAQRYDLRTGRIKETPITVDCDLCTAGWAADSTRYTVMLRGAGPDSETGPVRYLNPDGTPGPLLGADGLIWGAEAYSPSRRYVIVEPPRPFIPDESAAWQRSKVFDLRTRRVVATLGSDYWPVSAWYDERHVVRTVSAAHGEPTELEIIDVRTGTATRHIAAPGLPPCCVSIGSSAGLRGAAAALGF